MRHSFCAASFRNTSPRCRRSSPYSVFLRHFGMKTTWYLHSHFVWLRLSSSSIDEVSFRVLGGSRSEASSMDPLKCQTSTATPAEPGGLSLTLEHFPPKWAPVGRRKCDKRIESRAHPCSVPIEIDST